MNIQERIIGVHLGRFAPYTKGHEKSTRAVINAHGIENSLILVGSSNVFNERTPFSFEQRRKMIETIIPGITIIPLPDTNPTLLVHANDSASLDKWYARIEKIQSDLNARLKFYGGSEEDLKYLGRRFETGILVDRETVGLGISATQVREGLINENTELLNQILDPKIIEMASGFYKENMRILTGNK